MLWLGRTCHIWKKARLSIFQGRLNGFEGPYTQSAEADTNGAVGYTHRLEANTQRAAAYMVH